MPSQTVNLEGLVVSDPRNRMAYPAAVRQLPQVGVGLAGIEFVPRLGPGHPSEGFRRPIASWMSFQQTRFISGLRSR